MLQSRGTVSRYAQTSVGVRKRYVKLLYDVYAPKLQPGFGKRRHAVLVGPSAAAMLGTRW